MHITQGKKALFWLTVSDISAHHGREGKAGSMTAVVGEMLTVEWAGSKNAAETTGIYSLQRST